MLDKKDIIVLQKMFVDNNKVFRKEMHSEIQANNIVFRKELREEMHSEIETSNHLLKREIRDELHSVVNAVVTGSERRIMDKMDKGFAQVDKEFAQVHKRFAQVDKEFVQVHKEIAQLREDVTDVIGDEIIPLIETNRRDIFATKRAIGIAVQKLILFVDVQLFIFSFLCTVKVGGKL